MDFRFYIHRCDYKNTWTNSTQLLLKKNYDNAKRTPPSFIKNFAIQALVSLVYSLPLRAQYIIMQSEHLNPSFESSIINNTIQNFLINIQYSSKDGISRKFLADSAKKSSNENAQKEFSYKRL